MLSFSLLGGCSSFNLYCTRINYATDDSVGDLCDQFRRVCGDELMSRIKLAWGWDSEGEVIGAWRNFGVPNMWYMMGRFFLFTTPLVSEMMTIFLFCLQVTWRFVDSIQVTSHFVSRYFIFVFLPNLLLFPPQKSRR